MIIIIIMNNSTQEMVELLDDYFVPSLSSLTKSAPNDFFFCDRQASKVGCGVSASVMALSASFFFPYNKSK